MKRLKLSIIAPAAAMLTGCGFGGTYDEPLTAAPAPVTTTATPASAKPQDNIQTFGAHIDASAFLNTLVESGCQIDKAEYKELKRGGAITVVCSKTVDALNVELDDL